MFFLKDLPTRTMMERYAKRFPEMDVGKTEQALTMLRQASLFIRRLEAYFAEHDLSQTRALILIVLDRDPDMDTFTIRDVVTRLDISKPVTTNTIKALEKDGLVKTSDCPDDARARRVMITDAGREKLYSIMPGYYQIINDEMTDAPTSDS